jgi:molybdate transport system substrate-binding protein
MSQYKIKPVLAGATAMLMLASNCASAATTATINVAVAANFAGTMASLVSSFKLANPGWNVTYTSDSSANLEAAIISGSQKYDLFLSADTTRPLELQNSYPALIDGAAFFYAYGVLEFWSAKTSNAISAGVPSNPLKFVIADPSKAPYGFAAGQVLGALGSPWSTWISCTPTPQNVTDTSKNSCTILNTSKIGTAANIGTTYSAIKSGVYPYGFVAQSQICTLKNGVKTFATGVHHTYVWNQAPTYNRIKQYGIKVHQATRSAAAQAELAAFISFLSSAKGTTIIKSFCYDLT